MTSPLQHGFPDWGRQSAGSDILVAYEVGTNITGSTDYGPFFVGDSPYLYVSHSAAVATNLSIAWFADAALTQSLFGDVITTASGGEAQQCIPVRGPWVRFRAERSAYPGIHNLRVYRVPTPFNVYAGTDGENNLIEENGTAVGAGATSTFNATSTRGGWIWWKGILEAAASTRILLLSVDFTGATHLLDYGSQDAGGTGRMILAPALPLRVTVFNNDAVPRNAYVSVAHHPFYP